MRVQGENIVFEPELYLRPQPVRVSSIVENPHRTQNPALRLKACKGLLKTAINNSDGQLHPYCCKLVLPWGTLRRFRECVSPWF